MDELMRYARSVAQHHQGCTTQIMLHLESEYPDEDEDVLFGVAITVSDEVRFNS